MKSQKRNFVFGLCVVGFCALAFSSTSVSAGALGGKPEESKSKVGEQPNSAVDDGTKKSLVPPASQPAGSIADQVEILDPDFGKNGGDRRPGPGRFDRTEIKFSFSRMREDGVALWVIDELGDEGSHAPGLKETKQGGPKYEYTMDEMGVN